MSFFLLTYALSWSLWIPAAADSQGLFHFSIPFWGIGSFGPSLAGIIITAVVSRRTGIQKLIRRLVQWRVGIQWYLIILVLPTAIILSAIGLHVLLGGTAPEFANINKWYSVLPLFFNNSVSRRTIK